VHSADRPRPAMAPIEELFTAARQGSEEALGQLFERCRPYLTMIAARELDPDLQAKAGPSDIVQDVFLSAHGAFATFEGASQTELQGWLRTILLHNLANLARRYRATEKRCIDLERPIDEGRVEARDGRHPSQTATDLVDLLIKREEATALSQALERLNELDRQVIHWRQWEKHSFPEIGTRLGKSAEAARKIWSRAVERLQLELDAPDGQV
jgi:RNA polymerase sigma-70 factor, ECF subfamily